MVLLKNKITIIFNQLAISMKRAMNMVFNKNHVNLYIDS
jgi:hypothetical protein